ncbi:HD-GYP domain-containing protein [Propionispora vibrioides]|uniref:HDIG domain-containing protein n=1 Tax=Propionispora vibrioides TaxID=112903 RepID=A0A1H8XC89_9FIRM|nr:HD-GYP domain-containing protein [Propionispora vibrioides]SEP37441.1 HDIG domain-containing protein [Propionispora vibrioides]
MFSNQYRVKTEELKPGMIVAQTVVSETGQVLLEQGTLLTEGFIQNLIKWQVPYAVVVMPYKIRSVQRRFFSFYEDTLSMITQTFERVRTFNEVPVAECRELVDSYIELLVNVVGVVDRLYRVKAHNEYTFQHSLNVAILSGVLGKWLGFKGQELKDIILAGLLHDVGKLLISQDILDKPGRLTDEEMRIIKTHPAHGYDLLSRCPELREEVRLAALQHHEREDGSGYPVALAGKEIHIYAKIVALADIYDAMSSQRVYRQRLRPFTVVDNILQDMQGKLDPRICITFLSNLRRFLLGSSVLLSDGNRAKIVWLNDLLRIRPVVRLDCGSVVDLAEEKQLEVVALLDDSPEV